MKVCEQVDEDFLAELFTRYPTIDVEWEARKFSLANAGETMGDLFRFERWLGAARPQAPLPSPRTQPERGERRGDPPLAVRRRMIEWRPAREAKERGTGFYRETHSRNGPNIEPLSPAQAAEAVRTNAIVLTDYYTAAELAGQEDE
jgi:hypothetical protein